MASIQSALQGHPISESLTEQQAEGAVEAMTALYVHVPFCRLRCPYCNFATAAYTSVGAHRFVEAVRLEAAALGPFFESARFRTLFLGGGTPSRLSPSDFLRLVEGLRQSLRLEELSEFTLEANPEDVDPDRIRSWQRGGVNRLSLGVQSLVDGELARLGRKHGSSEARGAMETTAGSFESWSVDLMFGYPGHRQTTWYETLASALSYQPPHLSLYQFTAERGTTLGEAVRAGRLSGVGDQDMVTLYDAARAACRGRGLEHYEISNFARPGHRSRHNLAYWRRRPYLGLGPGAVSMWRDRRWRNLSDTNRYTEAVLGGAPWVEESESVIGKEAMETVMLGLRLEEGVPWSDLPASESERKSWQRAARNLMGPGYLSVDEMGLRIPPGYRGVADSIILRLWEEAERVAESTHR